MAEETIISDGPMGLRFFFVSNEVRICGKCGKNVGVKLFLVHNDCSAENRVKELGCMEGCGDLFLSEHRSVVTQVYCSIVAISLFRVDVPASS